MKQSGMSKRNVEPSGSGASDWGTDRVPHDAEGGGYLEVRLRIHKTAQTLAKRNDLLPVIVSARSIKEGDWLGLVSAAFSRVGLSLEGVVRAGIFRPCKPGGPEPGTRSLRSSECTTMLKLILQRCGSVKQYNSKRSRFFSLEPKGAARSHALYMP